MKTISKLIYTFLLAIFIFNMANVQAFAAVSSYEVHRDPTLNAESHSSSEQTDNTFADIPSDSEVSVPSSSADTNEPVVASNGEYAVYLGMTQELPNQTPTPTPEPTPTPIPSSSSEDSSSFLEEASAKPEKVKLPPSCKLCKSCNGLFGVCLYVWIAFVIFILLCVLTVLIVILNAGNPKKEKVKKASKIHMPKISVPKINMPKISFRSLSKKSDMKIIKTKVKRSNKAKRFNIGRSNPFGGSKNTTTAQSPSVEDSLADEANTTLEE